MDGRNLMEQQELSLTLKYLMDNPALLQPPDTNNNEKCKDDKSLEQAQQTDLTSAYLGPQIWSDMLLSDDLKLEPVDLDELLDTTGLEDEMGDLTSLMASPQRPAQELQRGSSDDTSQSSYQDMPSLMSAHRSPDAKQVPSPSVYFHYPTPPRQVTENEQPLRPLVQGIRSPPQHTQLEANRKQKLAEMQLFDQQFAILNDILANNNQYEESNVQQLPVHTAPNQALSFSSVETPSQFQHHPQTLQVSQRSPAQTNTNSNFLPSPINQSPTYTSPVDTAQQVTEVSKRNSTSYTPSTSPVTQIEIRIPSPKRVNFVPNTTDVIISTPQDTDCDTPFDPCTRSFTEEELKPQPIIRKSKKVHVPADSKDGKYWNRRNKNNLAAKRSREARRIKENQIAMRANFLEQENATLKTEISELRKELTKVVEVVKKYEKRFSISNN